MTLNLLPEILLDRPLRQFPNLWSAFPSSFSTAFDESLFPQEFTARGARIYEEGNSLHVEVPVPGLKADEIEVSLNRGVLLVKGEAKEETQDKKRKYYRSSTRSYSYSLTLPTQIDEKQEPQAVYTDGILNITLEKAKQTETKKITVKHTKK